MFSIGWYKPVFKCSRRASLGYSYYATQRLWWRAQYYTDLQTILRTFTFFCSSVFVALGYRYHFKLSTSVGFGSAARIRILRLLNAQTRRCAPHSRRLAYRREQMYDDRARDRSRAPYVSMSMSISRGKSISLRLPDGRREYFTTRPSLPIVQSFNEAVDGVKIHVG